MSCEVGKVSLGKKGKFGKVSWKVSWKGKFGGVLDLHSTFRFNFLALAFRL